MWRDSPIDAPMIARFLPPWTLLAAFALAATFLSGLPVYRALLLVIALAAALMAIRSPGWAAVLLVGTPVVDAYGIIFSVPQVITVFQIVLVAAVVGGLRHVLRARIERRQDAVTYQLRKRVTPWDIGILAFMLAALVSLPLSEAPIRSLVAVVQLSMLLGMYAIVSRTSTDVVVHKAVVLTVVFMGAYSAILALIQVFGPWSLAPALEFHPTGNELVPLRASGFFLNPNTLGVMLVLSTLLAMEHVLRSPPSTLRSIPHLLAAVLCLAGIAVTFSRAAFIGIVVGAVVLVILVAPKRPATWVQIAIVLLAITLVIPAWGTSERLASFLDLRNDESAMDRVFLSQVSLEMFRDYPLTGVGISAFPIAYESYIDPRITVQVTDGHQMPFSIPAETGFIGLVAMSLMVIALAARLRRIRRLSVSHELPVAAIAVSISLLFMSFFNTFLFFKSFWTTLALVGSLFLLSGMDTGPNVRLTESQEQ